MSSSIPNLPAVIDLHSVLVTQSSSSHACQKPHCADVPVSCVQFDYGSEADSAVAVHIRHLKHFWILQV